MKVFLQHFIINRITFYLNVFHTLLINIQLQLINIYAIN